MECQIKVVFCHDALKPHVYGVGAFFDEPIVAAGAKVFQVTGVFVEKLLYIVWDVEFAVSGVDLCDVLDDVSLVGHMDADSLDEDSSVSDAGVSDSAEL